MGGAGLGSDAPKAPYLQPAGLGGWWPAGRRRLPMGCGVRMSHNRGGCHRHKRHMAAGWVFAMRYE